MTEHLKYVKIKGSMPNKNMKLIYLLKNYKSELIYIAFISALVIYTATIMLPVATHGTANPICDALIGNHIACTTSP